MTMSLTADAASLINWTFTNNSLASRYISLLGLPVSTHKQISQGRPKFVGIAVESCDDLYKSTLRKRDVLKSFFSTKESLRQADGRKHNDLMALVAEPLLMEYGHTLWSPAEPYVTCISPEYPKILNCDDVNDRQRFVSVKSSLSKY
jgi:hypothetical protein